MGWNRWREKNEEWKGRKILWCSHGKCDSRSWIKCFEKAMISISVEGRYLNDPSSIKRVVINTLSGGIELSKRETKAGI